MAPLPQTPRTTGRDESQFNSFYLQTSRSVSSEGRLNYSVVSAGKPRLGCSAYPSLLELSYINTLGINMPTLFSLHTLLFLPLLNGNTREKFARDPQGSRSPFKKVASTQFEKLDSTQKNGCLGTEYHSCPEVTVSWLGDMRASSTKVG